MREGARALDPGLAEMAQSFRMTRWRTLRHVMLPQLTPYFFAAARSGLALIWKIVLVVELLGRSNGVGFQIQIYFQLFDVTLILAYTLAFIAGRAGDRVGRPAAAGALGDAMAEVILRLRVERKSFRTGRGDLPVLGSIDLALGRARDRRAGRAVRLRQDDAAADHRRPGDRLRGQRSTGTAPRCRASARCSRSRACCPGAPCDRTFCWRSGPRTRTLPTTCCGTLDLAPFRDAFPPTLSLGMARRAAIARAFAIEPELVLLDEPFVSLDPAMAARSRELLLDAWRARPTAALLVTHDRAEAAALADRILLLAERPTHVLDGGRRAAGAAPLHGRADTGRNVGPRDRRRGARCRAAARRPRMTRSLA